MKIGKQISKFIASILSVALLFGCIPFAASAEGENSEFVSENLLSTKIDLENSSGVIWYRNGRTIEESDVRGLGAETVAGLVDGDLENSFDIIPYGAIEYRCFGIRYAITETTYVSEFAMYGDYSNLPCYYDIYVSDTLDNLHFGGNFIGTVKCDGTVQKLSVNRNVKYLLVLFNSIKTNDNNARPKEVQLWSGNPETEFTPSNLVKSEKLDSYSAVLVSGESAGAYAQNNDKVTTVVTKDISNAHTDLYSNSNGYTGIQFALTEMTYIGKVLIDAGIWNSSGTYNEKYTVYASATLNDLYSNKSIVASDILCGYSSPTMVEVNRYAQYIAVVCTEHNGIRIRNILIFDALADPNEELPFVSKNVLKTNLESSRCIQFYPSNYYVDAADKISTETLASFTDGNISSTTDCYTGLDYNPPRYIGAEFTLDGTYFVGELNIYSGYTTSLDTFEVYASDKFETLYSAESLVAKNVVCDGTKKTLTVNKNIKYVTFLISGIELYCARIAEFEAFTADPSEVFVSENVLLKNSSAKSIAKYVSTGTVNYESIITDGKLAAFTDGDTKTHNDLNATLEWDPRRYIGAEFTLDAANYIGNIKLYASIGEKYPETYSIYASDTLESLYNDSSCVAADVSTTGSAIVAEVNATVQYIAFICKSYTDNPRFKEIEAWTADPNEAPKPEDTSKKVLTIGNSFAQNASTYATEIAYANGEELTFGYLMFPSCTIDMHYEAAAADRHIFRFKVTTPDNMQGTLLKDYPVDQNFNQDLPETAASIKEALEYTDWDIIVFQQESSSARYYENFSHLGDLINYVRGYCPKAKLMFHQVWRWGEWGADQFSLIKANSETAAREYGLDIIPTGLAFEYARKALGADTAVNENDGHYQHANTYGMYIAGCVYTAAIFGKEISENTFTSHPYVNDNGKVALLTAAANKAVDYYNSIGDLNDDGNVNSSDMVLLKKYLLGSGTVDTTLADANGDGQVNIIDLIRIKRYLADNRVSLGR